jgi:hypothetical protein
MPIMRARNKESRTSFGEVGATGGLCARTECFVTWPYHSDDVKTLTVSFDSYSCSLFWYWKLCVTQDFWYLWLYSRLLKFATQKTAKSFVNNQLDVQFFFMYVYFYSLQRSLIQTCTPNGHLYRVTYTRCRIDTINSPDDGHVAARNM